MAYVVEDSDRAQFETPVWQDAAFDAYTATTDAGLAALLDGALSEAPARIRSAVYDATQEAFTPLYTDYANAVITFFGEDAYLALVEQQAERKLLYLKRLPSSLRQLEDTWLQWGLAWLRDYLEDSLTAIAATTTRIFVREVTNGVEAGENPKTIARRLRKLLPDSNRVRAERWVRTEITGLSNYGSRAGATEAGAEKKSWLATPDSRTRTTHALAHKQTVVITAKFKVGTEEADEPGDPALSMRERANCRCTTIFFLDDEDPDELLDEIVDVEVEENLILA